MAGVKSTPRILTGVLACLFAVGYVKAASDPASAAPVDHGNRYAFAAAMAKLTPGMSAAEVKAILGKPDDIRTQFDPGGPTGESTRRFSLVEDIRMVRDYSARAASPFKQYHLNEIWAYGTNGHLTKATLGMVYMDDDGRLEESFGGKGEPPLPGQVEEADLRHYLRVLADVPPWMSSGTVDPKKIIRAVNLLKPIGKARALAAIAEFLRVTPGDDWDRSGRGGIVLVLEALFEWPRADARPRAYRHLVPVGDIPFVRSYTGSFMGAVPQPEPELEYFRAHGVLFTQPLAPTTRPMVAVENFLATNPDKTYSHGLFLPQILNLLDTVHRKETDSPATPGSYRKLPEEWENISAEVAKLSLRWDDAESCYTFAEGWRLMPLVELHPAYRRQIWHSPAEVARPFSLILERQSKKTVNLVFRWQADQVFHLRFYNPDHPETTLLKFSANGGPTAALQIEAGVDRKLPAMKTAAGNLGRAYQITILSNVGESLVAEYSVDGTLIHSPVLTP